MVPNDGLARIFWPSQKIEPEATGVLVGWRNSELDILVAAILFDVEVSGSQHGPWGCSDLVSAGLWKMRWM